MSERRVPVTLNLATPAAGLSSVVGLGGWPRQRLYPYRWLSFAVGLFAPGDPRLMTRLMHATHQVRLLDWLEDGMRVPPSEVIRRMQRELVCMFCVPEHIAQLLAERQLLDPVVDAG